MPSLTFGALPSAFPILSIADASVREGGYLEFPVTLSFPSRRHYVVFDFEILDTGTATAGVDYGVRHKTTDWFRKRQVATEAFVQTFDDAIDDDGETIDVRISNARLEDIDGNLVQALVIERAEATGTIRNRDPMPKAWLVRFGRTVGSQAVDALTDRFDAETGMHVTLGGVRLSGLPAHERDPPGGVRFPGGRDRMALSANGNAVRTMTGRTFAHGSAFHLSGGVPDAAAPAYTAWGRVSTGRFEGREGA